MMLFSPGAPLTPIGGSSWSLRKSRINLRRAAVDMIVLEIEFNKIQQFKQFQCGQLYITCGEVLIDQTIFG